MVASACVAGLSARYLLLLILLGSARANQPLLAGQLTFSTPACETVINAGPVDSKIDVVIIGEGYTSGQMNCYSNAVNALIDDLFGKAPYDIYKSYFNVHKVMAISLESGTDNSTYGQDGCGQYLPPILRNTAFDSYIDSNGLRVVLTPNLQTAASKAPDADFVYVIVNCDGTGVVRGGANAKWAFGEHGTTSGVFPHEMGHSFGDLGDEYGAGQTIYSGPEPLAVNLDTTPASIKWDQHLGFETVGIFEGGAHVGKGIFRPTDNMCVMRSVTLPFCRVCRLDGIRQAIEAHASWSRADVTPLSLTTTIAAGDLAADAPDGGVIWTQPPDPSVSIYYVDVTALANQLYVVGYDNAPGAFDFQWRIERRVQATGDKFATNSVANSNPSTAWDQASAVAVDSTGLYVVGHETVSGSNKRWRIEKRNLNTLAMLPNFPVFSDPSTSSDVATWCAVDGTALYVVGYDSSQGAGNSQWRIEKRNLITGALIGGPRVDNFTSGSDKPWSAALGNDGYLYVVGEDSPVGQGRAWRMAQYSIQGLGQNGLAGANYSTGDDIALAVAVSNGRVFIGGVDSVGGDKRWRVQGRSKMFSDVYWDDISDPSPSLDDSISRIAVDDAGLYVVGAVGLNGADPQWLIRHYGLDSAVQPVQGEPTPAGSLIWSQSSNPTTAQDSPGGALADGSRLYLVGWSESGVGHIECRSAGASRGAGVYLSNVGPASASSDWRVEKRSRMDGSPIWVKETSYSNYQDTPTAMAVDNTSVFVVGEDLALSASNAQWRLEERDLMTGAVINTVSANFSSGWDRATAVSIDATHVYVVGWDMALTSNCQWRIQKRSRATNLPVVNSTVSNPSATYDDAPAAVVAAFPTLYVAGNKGVNGTARVARFEVRDASNLALLKAHDDAVTGTYGGEALGMCADSSNLYIVGYRDIGSAGSRNDEWVIEAWFLPSLTTTPATSWPSKYLNPSSGADWAVAAAVIGNALYVGGFDSTQGAGYTRWRVAKLNKGTGAVLWERQLDSQVNGEIRGISASDTGVYLGGVLKTFPTGFYPKMARISAKEDEIWDAE
jgi:hypothetical protein